MKLIKARVLVDLKHNGTDYKVNDVIELDKESIEDLEYHKHVDPHPDAVKHAEGLKRRNEIQRKIDDGSLIGELVS